jgi:hypothetical protein
LTFSKHVLARQRITLNKNKKDDGVWLGFKKEAEAEEGSVSK